MSNFPLKSVSLSMALLLSVAAPAFADDASELRAFKTAIRAQYDLEETAFKNKDAEAIANQFYSEDAIVVPPGPGLSIGRQQILEGYRQHMDGTARIVSFKTHVNGNNGLDWVNFYLTPYDPAEKPTVFKALVLWEKRHGKWISIGEMFMPGAYPVDQAAAK